MQPVLAAVQGARAARTLVAADLAGETDTSRAILDRVDLVRGDAREISAATGVEVSDFASAAQAAMRLLAHGPRIAVVEAGGEGDLIATRQTELRVPRLPITVVYPTGAGDALITTLAVLLASDVQLETAAGLGRRPRRTRRPPRRAADLHR